MIDNDGKLCIYNDNLETADRFEPENSQIRQVVYEVIRVISKIPLFLEDHYARLENSMNLLGFGLNKDREELAGQIVRLVDVNQKQDCNVKVVVFADSTQQDYLFYISKSYYPGQDEIGSGVPVALFRWNRENPNIKLVNRLYREAVAACMEEKHVFEVLLVNELNEITEGSKSNVFFVKGGRVFTAPGESVLKGVTRKYVFKACKELGIEVVEEFVSCDRLAEMEGSFLSGTSIKVLPISGVEQYKYNSSSHALIMAIRDKYDRIIDEYILGHASR